MRRLGFCLFRLRDELLQVSLACAEFSQPLLDRQPCFHDDGFWLHGLLNLRETLESPLVYALQRRRSGRDDRTRFVITLQEKGWHLGNRKQPGLVVVY